MLQTILYFCYFCMLYYTVTILLVTQASQLYIYKCRNGYTVKSCTLILCLMCKEIKALVSLDNKFWLKITGILSLHLYDTEWSQQAVAFTQLISSRVLSDRCFKIMTRKHFIILLPMQLCLTDIQLLSLIDNT